MDSPRIPIRNLYYLLCYAWNHLKQGDLVDVSKVPTTDLADLLAMVLCEGIQHLARRGLEQGYQLREEDRAGVRGRVDTIGTARRFLVAHGRAACRYDELTVNTLSNQILTSTLRLLGRVESLHDDLRKRVAMLRRDLHEIDDIDVTRRSFRRVQLHTNNRFYRFLLNICELVHGSWLVDQASGEVRFRDFLRDERVMARVFQDFLFNFIRTEIPNWEVKRERIGWRAESDSDPDLTLLPRMETDISLRRGPRHVIIDAKYYQSSVSQYYDAVKLHGHNLYQLMSYLTNADRRDGEELSGMLIYPQVDRRLRERYTIQGYQVAACTVDLNQEWRDVHDEIVGIVR